MKLLIATEGKWDVTCPLCCTNIYIKWTHEYHYDNIRGESPCPKCGEKLFIDNETIFTAELI